MSRVIAAGPLTLVKRDAYEATIMDIKATRNSMEHVIWVHGLPTPLQPTTLSELLCSLNRVAMGDPSLIHTCRERTKAESFPIYLADTRSAAPFPFHVDMTEELIKTATVNKYRECLTVAMVKDGVLGIAIGSRRTRAILEMLMPRKIDVCSIRTGKSVFHAQLSASPIKLAYPSSDQEALCSAFNILHPTLSPTEAKKTLRDATNTALAQMMESQQQGKTKAPATHDKKPPLRALESVVGSSIVLAVDVFTTPVKSSSSLGVGYGADEISDWRSLAVLNPITGSAKSPSTAEKRKADLDELFGPDTGDEEAFGTPDATHEVGPGTAESLVNPPPQYELYPKVPIPPCPKSRIITWRMQQGNMHLLESTSGLLGKTKSSNQTTRSSNRHGSKM